MAKHGLYALYVPSAIKPVQGLVMERFPSREVCGNVLKERIHAGKSRLYTDRSRRWIAPQDRPFTEWPVFDETGYMRVWLTSAGDDWPAPLSRPDEEWIVSESGKLERLPWTDNTADGLYLANRDTWINTRIIK